MKRIEAQMPTAIFRVLRLRRHPSKFSIHKKDVTDDSTSMGSFWVV